MSVDSSHLSHSSQLVHLVLTGWVRLNDCNKRDGWKPNDMDADCLLLSWNSAHGKVCLETTSKKTLWTSVHYLFCKKIKSRSQQKHDQSVLQQLVVCRQNLNKEIVSTRCDTAYFAVPDWCSVVYDTLISFLDICRSLANVPCSASSVALKDSRDHLDLRPGFKAEQELELWKWNNSNRMLGRKCKHIWVYSISKTIDLKLIVSLTKDLKSFAFCYWLRNLRNMSQDWENTWICYILLARNKAFLHTLISEHLLQSVSNRLLLLLDHLLQPRNKGEHPRMSPHHQVLLKTKITTSALLGWMCIYMYILRYV